MLVLILVPNVHVGYQLIIPAYLGRYLILRARSGKPPRVSIHLSWGTQLEAD